MANVTLASTTAELSAKNLITEEGAHTVLGLLTYDRHPSAPFAVAASSAKVTNLDADMVDGLHASDLGGADTGSIETITAVWTFSTNPVFNANAIPETAIADGALLARLAANEQIAGAWSVKAGTSTLYGFLGGTLYTTVTAVGNVGAGEDTLYTQSLAANLLSTNGQKVTFSGFGSYAANANTKRLRIKFGSSTIFDSSTTTSGGGFIIEGTIIRTGAATQISAIKYTHGTTGGTDHRITVGTATETLSGAVVLLITGEATSNDDISLSTLTVRWEPVGN